MPPYSRLRYSVLLLAVLVTALLSGCAGSRSATAPEAPVTPPPPAPPAAVGQSDLLAQLPPVLDTVKAGRFDYGKMWTFDFPPVDFFNEEYGMNVDAAWFEHVRLATLRLPNCTASFVSPHGLVMTNNHCVRDQLTSISREGENLNDEGFVAVNLADERPVPGWFADQLIAITDVTAEIDAAVAGAQTDAERAAARQRAMAGASARIAAEAGGAQAGMTVQIISLFQGARYSAYTFRRFTDLRMVMATEHAIGYFGGDYDNFTYPRYDVDAAFFRVYVDDRPYEPEHYFTWSKTGIGLGEPVFIIGNPGSTNRLETTAQLVWRRDVEEKATLELYNYAADILMAQHDRTPDQTLHNLVLSLQNSGKAFSGRVTGLNDPVLMARKRDSERRLQAAIDANAELKARYGTLIPRIEALVREKLAYAAEYRTFLALTSPLLSSTTLLRAFMAYSVLRNAAVPLAPSQQGDLESAIGQVPDQDPQTDRAYLIKRLWLIQDAFGADSPLARQVLGGRSPEAAAEAILQESVLSSSGRASEGVRAGTLTADDPAVAVVAAIFDRYREYSSAGAGFTARETELNAELGRARFAVYGTALPPDATFSLRIADGVVKPYAYNGTLAPAFTTFYGMYDRFHSFGKGEGLGKDWSLPERWKNPPATFDLSTRVNFVSTNDIIGGNSGSPMISKDLEVVGLAFDGNVESLPWSFIYTTETGRAVSVDVLGLTEALDEIYDADRIVRELETHELMSTEAEADAAGTP